MYQNYPNPFNSQTNIRFDLPEKSQIKLTLFDILGRNIQELISMYLNEGAYTYPFNAERLNSGIYFIRLETNKYNSIIRIVLIK